MGVSFKFKIVPNGKTQAWQGIPVLGLFHVYIYCETGSSIRVDGESGVSLEVTERKNSGGKGI